MVKWVALFSQTGNEIERLSKKFNRFPDIIISNAKNKESVNVNIAPRTVFIDHNEINYFLSNLEKDTICTLHGYLRIIPMKNIYCKISCINRKRPSEKSN